VGALLDGEDGLPPGARPFTMLFAALGVWGAIEHYRRDRTSWWYMFNALRHALVRARLLPELQVRLLAEAPGADRDLHEVRERDYFFIVSFSVWGLWAGIGIVTLWQRRRDGARGDAREGESRAGARAHPARAQLGLGEPRRRLLGARLGVQPAHERRAVRVLFTNGDNDTFPLWYLQEVEGIRRTSP
jgi:hypothetical protein